ncbi:lasso peptide biosynthesis B2 protein [Paenibacillus crassostreae]|uniref:Stage V sporulation protein S n=1 Tax=Paenibacillus crassostreae TaxID=1763538 RepID=A0A167GCE4_9BACL|nr:lasso peptide biosynthesis B2 protein [Paenibacillus crassostreae]AOZ92672.1 stage V sporulation protein S [Paenibacillus crassostreae]OAB77441.1 stage V sporulation protein S [Paenibacillus crassostreae]
MSLYRKVRRFSSYPLDVKWMFVEAYFYLAWGRVLKLLPFSKVAPSLGSHMKETSFTSYTEQDLLLLRKVSRAVHTMSRVTWWESQCMVKAIAAMKMLERRGIPSTMYLGSGRDEKGQMVAHAWLRSGSYILTGKEGHEKYTVVGIFGNDKQAEALTTMKR